MALSPVLWQVQTVLAGLRHLGSFKSYKSEKLCPFYGNFKPVLAGLGNWAVLSFINPTNCAPFIATSNQCWQD
jgi:hypothetical protein